ncbi:MAG: hypothetical protein WCI20_04675 [bacterium]
MFDSKRVSRRRLWCPAFLLTVILEAATLYGADAVPAPELPEWPIAFATASVPAPKPDAKGVVKAPLMAWLPPQAKHIRALIIIPNNTDLKGIGEHARIRDVAAKHEMAVVYLRQGDVPQVQEILDALAEKTGIPDIRHAPWIPLGKSSRGLFPALMEWKDPKRTIASIVYHGETPTWPVPATAKLGGESIIHVNVNGESEWGGTWFLVVRPSLLNYRAQANWLPHQVIVRGVGHGDYPDGQGSAGWGKPVASGQISCLRVWDYLAVFIDKAVALRVPKDKYPTDTPLELNRVNDEGGYLIDPFAVEDLYRQPHYPLNATPAGYAVVESTPSLFVKIAPAANFTPPDGVPVVPPPVGRSPDAWLVTETMKFVMKNDPMTDLAGLDKLRPKPGDKVRIDDYEATFHPIDPKAVAGNGGIALSGRDFTLLGYTVIHVPETMRLRLKAPFSVIGRLQIVLNGVPVEHQSIVELREGMYPLLLVLRKKYVLGASWGSVSPYFEPVTGVEAQKAIEYTAEKARRDSEQTKILAEGIRNAIPPIRKAADVPREDRKTMFWVADREQAEAWFKLHAIHGQKFDIP